VRIDQALASGASVQKDRNSGQVSLFGEIDMGPAPKSIIDSVNFTPWTLGEKLGHEKELLGFYVTGHPLDAYRDLLESEKYLPISHLADQEDRSTVQIAGFISAFEKKFTRKEGKPFAIITVEDFTGSAEVMVWGEAFAKNGKEIDKGKIVVISAKLDKREDNIRLVANEVGPITKGKGFKGLTIDIPMEKTDETRLMAIRDLVREFPGAQPLFLRFRSLDGREVRLKADPGYAVRDDQSFRERLAELLL
jgi:DNA polymerase-3 subunit alpha